MKNKITVFLIILAFSFSIMATAPAYAQDVPHVVSTTMPVDGVMREKLDAWLATNAPVNVPYYAITYAQLTGLNDYYVSIAALNITTPDQPWSMEADANGNTTVAWTGTVIVYFNGTVEPYSVLQTQALSPSIKILAMPAKSFADGAGGGRYVHFPWQPSKNVLYGILGVHSPGYGLSASAGWVAVDLVSGNDMGPAAANDSVYASVTGTVDYVCQDSQSVAVKLSGGGDSFLYAHMLDNANLTMGHTFSAGSVIGTLRHGSFTGDISGNCGYAVQTSEHWHLHWAFIKSSTTFQAEGCVLKRYIGVGAWDVSIGTAGHWNCGNTVVKVNQPLAHYGAEAIDPNTGASYVDPVTGAHLSPNDTGIGQVNTQNFFTMFLWGLKSVFDALIGNVLPEHNSAISFINPILNGIKIVFRISNVLLHGNFNLIPAITMISLAIAFRATIGAIQFAGAILRIIKSLPFT